MGHPSLRAFAASCETTHPAAQTPAASEVSPPLAPNHREQSSEPTHVGCYSSNGPLPAAPAECPPERGRPRPQQRRKPDAPGSSPHLRSEPRKCALPTNPPALRVTTGHANRTQGGPGSCRTHSFIRSQGSPGASPSHFRGNSFFVRGTSFRRSLGRPSVWTPRGAVERLPPTLSRSLFAETAWRFAHGWRRKPPTGTLHPDRADTCRAHRPRPRGE
jgi:hypothetical protein